jgi:hypothetical protein
MKTIVYARKTFGKAAFVVYIKGKIRLLMKYFFQK